MVTKCLKYHDQLPESIRDYVRQHLLTEDHLEKITSLFVAEHFSPWLTTEQTWEELANWVVQGRLKDGDRSVRATKQEVERWKKFIAPEQPHL